MRARSIFAAIALNFGSMALAGEPVEEGAVMSGRAKLDPAKGYILLQGSTRQVASLIRVPDKDDLTAYEADLEKAFAKQLRRHAMDVAEWKTGVRLAQATKSPPPAEPAPAPTRENFSIGPIEPRTLEQIGPQNLYSKDAGASLYSYLTAVKPGTYIWYGPLVRDDTGLNGLCYCLGSIRFEVKAGVITHLGNFPVAAPQAQLQPSAPLIDIYVPISSGFSAMKLKWVPEPEEVRFIVPASLKAWPVEKADFRASGKIDNFFGVMISRLPPIAGVLAYDRDSVIDMRAGNIRLP